MRCFPCPSRPLRPPEFLFPFRGYQNSDRFLMFSAPCDFVSTAPYSYKFGPSSGTALLTMTVADYSRQALLRQCCCIEVRESSSGKNAFFPTMYLLHLHLGFRVASGFILFSRLTHLQMPYAVSVRQVSGLPPASFRSRLAADTLALGYVLGATPCTRDFHPLERAHAERTKNKAACGRLIFCPEHLGRWESYLKRLTSPSLPQLQKQQAPPPFPPAPRDWAYPQRRDTPGKRSRSKRTSRRE